MKQCLAFLLCFAASSLFCFSKGVETNQINGEGLKLELKLTETGAPFRIGKPKLLSVTVTNHASKVFYVLDRHPSRDFDVIIQDMAGNRLNAEQKMRNEEEEELRKLINPLEQNEGRVFQIDLDGFYNIMSSGKYRVTVNRDFYDLKTSTKVISNTLEIEVVNQ